jgi:gliding motility-associated-like protein
MRSLSRLLLVILVAFASKAGATHIVGGEIYYECQGNNTYLITLKIYRDCYNGVAPYDNPASIGIYDVNNNLVQNLMLTFPGSVVLPNTLNSPCFLPPTDVCVEEAIYTGTVVLPPLAGGYFLAYQRCCRNGTIVNLVNPGDQGATYMAHIPDPALAACNSSPHYNNFPPIFLCAGNPLYFDHSATDPDGDSLAYELCDPFHGADNLTSMPQPPAPGPYPYVTFSFPYNGTYPMSSNPALAIDPVTGLVTGTPNQVGQWVVGVCVKEYRNGQLLSVNKRDFQFNVVNCPGLVVASVPAQQTFCNGFTVNFANNSFNASSYHWDFGDPSITADTSNLATPSWTYANPGVYNVMLVGNPNTPCADTGFTTFQVYPLLDPSFVPPPGQCFAGNNFSFTAGGSFMGNGTFNWSFGPNATPSTSTAQNPSGITFNAPGTYTVTLTVSENNCTQTFESTVIVYPMPTADFNATPVSGCAPYLMLFTDSSIAGTTLNYLWDFGDGTQSTLPSPSHVYMLPGVYDVTLTIETTNGCIATHTFNVPGMVTVHPLPTAGFTVDPMVTSIFNPFVTVSDQSFNSVSCSYDFGNGVIITDTCDYTYAYPEAGTYTVIQTVTNVYGCPDTASVTVEIKHEYRFWIPNAFTPNGDGLNDVFMPSIMGVDEYRFLIFDRWGELIFETDNFREGWDGRVKGNMCQQEVYVYRLDFRDLVEYKEHTYIGRVTLVR